MNFPFIFESFVAPLRDNPAVEMAIVSVLVLIVLDIIFGLINALIKHEFSSKKMRDGIAHKCAELGFILVGIVIDATIVGGFDLGFSAPVLMSVCIYLALMEIGSLLETFATLNPQLADSPLFRLLESTKGIREGDSND